MDASFGVAGIVTKAIPGYSGGAVAVVAQEDGKILVAGEASAGAAEQCLFVMRLLPDGETDQTYGSSGFFYFGNGSGLQHSMKRLLLQTDGRAVVVAQSASTLAAFRLDANGRLDHTFSVVPRAFATPVKVKSATLQSDDRVLICGETAPTDGTTKQGWIIRLTKDGESDVSFGLFGRVNTAGRSATCIAQDFKGRILIVRSASTIWSTDYAAWSLARFSAAGQEETGFAPGLGENRNDDEIRMVLRVGQPDEIVVAKQSTSASSRIWVARLTENGPIAFSNYCTLSSTSVANETLAGMEIQDGGGILVSCNVNYASYNQRYQAGVLQLDYLGEANTNFGTSGLVVASVGTYDSSVAATALQGDGKFLVVGRTGTTGVIGTQLVVARFEPAPAPPPVPSTIEITSHPQSVTSLRATEATFSVAAHVVPPGDPQTVLSYSWFRNGQFLSGGTKPTLTVSASAATAGQYVVRISAGQDSATSEPAVLTVPEPVKILVEPGAQRVALGSSVSLPLRVTGPPPLTCRWTKDGELVSSMTSDAENADFELTFVAAPSSPGSYQAEISSPLGSCRTFAASLEVFQDPLITSTGDEVRNLGDWWQTGVTYKSEDSEVRVEWFKNQRRMPNVEDWTFIGSDAITATDAGMYQAAFANSKCVTWGPSVRIAVTDPEAKQLFAKSGETVRISAAVAGPELTYAWTLDGQPITNSRASGVDTKTLTISNAVPEDNGVYVCMVGYPGVPGECGPVQLFVSAQPPSLAGNSPPGGTVGTPYSFALAATPTAMRFKAARLPAGLTCELETGLISGVPRQAGDFTATVVASNASGQSQATALAFHIDSIPVPIDGRYSGFVSWLSEGETAYRVEIRVLPNGMFSGNMEVCWLKGKRYRVALKGAFALEGDQYVFSKSIKVPGYTVSGGKGTIRLELSPVDRIVGIQFESEVAEGDDLPVLAPSPPSPGPPPVITGCAKHVPWDARRFPATAYLGSYNFELSFDSGAADFEGDGFAIMKVLADGRVIGSGKLPDNTPFVSSAVLFADGSIGLTSWLYHARGYVTAELPIRLGTAPEYANNALRGEISWVKNSRVPTEDGELDLEIDAMARPYDVGKYLPPNTAGRTGPLVMNLVEKPNNLNFTLLEGGEDLNAIATVSRSQAGRSAPNPDRSKSYNRITRLSFNPRSGTFSGELAIYEVTTDDWNLDSDGNPKILRSTRTRTFQGLVTCDSTGTYFRGHGFSRQKIYWIAFDPYNVTIGLGSFRSAWSSEPVELAPVPEEPQ